MIMKEGFKKIAVFLVALALPLLAVSWARC
jgi:hypothetical protein